MEKIDKRKHYVLVLDTETANTIQDGKKMDMSNVLVYDCGWCVCDTKGNVYEERSFVNRDVFCYERNLMQSAYYGWKIPRYVAEIQAGMRTMADLYEIRQAMIADMEKYGITEVVAHNARFDYNALNCTERYVTKSAFRYFFPFGTVMLDTMKAVRQIMFKMPTYRKFCEENGYVTANGQPRATAEIAYRFISGNNEFEEEHTALSDVRIEREILWYCRRQHKKMDMRLWANEEEKSEPTEMQKQIMRIVRGY